jgi:uncharacterized membrane protein (UPF0127 family)
MMKRIIFSGLILLSCLLFTADSFIPMLINETKLMVEIADNQQKRITGLMFRKSIPDDYGMLFIFEDEDIQSMWMKNTLINLDLIFINKDKQIVDMHLDVPPCKSDPCPSYIGKYPAKYVLELKGGIALKIGLKQGDRLYF